MSISDVNLLDSSFQLIFSNVSSTASSIVSLAPNFGDGPNDYDLTGPDGQTILGAPSSLTGRGKVNAIFWSQYAGTGNFLLNVDADTVS